MTQRTKVNRPVSPTEIAVIRAALERVPVAAEYSALGVNLESLRVINKCQCGCDSVDFEAHDADRPPTLLADGVGTTEAGGGVGVIVWGRADAITGLEVYDLSAGDEDLHLPVPDSIRPWEQAAT
jgi:hypothetical protein